MEETLKLILDKLNSMDSDIKDLKQGQNRLEQGQKSLEQGQKNLEQRQLNLEDKLDSFEKQTMRRFNEIDSKISSLSDAVADLMEFRTEAESKLKKIK